MFYKATVQVVVILFGSETWNLTPTIVKRLKGFHTWSAYRMAHTSKPRRSPSGKWTYSSSEDMLSKVGIHNIADYIAVLRQTIASFIVNLPIFSFYKTGEWRSGTSPRQFWWEQPMDLDAARVLADPEPDFGQGPVKPT